MQFVFFYPKVIQKHFWKTVDFVKNLEMTQIAAGRGGGEWGGVTQLWRNACKNWYVFTTYSEPLFHLHFIFYVIVDAIRKP